MRRILNYTAGEEFSGRTLLDYLKAQKYTHAVLVQIKQTENGLLLNGRWAYVSERLKAGDRIQVVIEEKHSPGQIPPADIPVQVIYEDEDFIVVDKPSGMPVHPSQGNYGNTLANALVHYYQKQGDPFVFRCVNRLDRDTTGLVLVAKHLYSSSLLASMAARREIYRTYLAILEGVLPEEGTVIAPIARADGSTIERCVDEENGEYACTHYRRLNTSEGYSLAELKLETGRTHQIRVHMKHIGHPLPGDFLYHPKDTRMNRQALHSWRLGFTHPVTGRKMSFEAPVPEDMRWGPYCYAD